MKKSLRFDRELTAQVSALPEDRLIEFWKAIGRFIDSFGRPHAHSGLGIRKLGHGVFEFRVGIDLRVIVRDREDDIWFEFIGSHDEVQREIRKGKFK